MPSHRETGARLSSGQLMGCISSDLCGGSGLIYSGHLGFFAGVLIESHVYNVYIHVGSTLLGMIESVSSPKDV
jgi:hypothetical protein